MILSDVTDAVGLHFRKLNLLTRGITLWTHQCFWNGIPTDYKDDKADHYLVDSNLDGFRCRLFWDKHYVLIGIRLKREQINVDSAAMF